MKKSMKKVLTILAVAPNLFLRTQHVVFGSRLKSPIVRDSVDKIIFAGPRQLCSVFSSRIIRERL